jgi:hypothetical protein
MNTSEHDDWERLFRQRLADFEDQPAADALTRILAAANMPPIPTVTSSPLLTRMLGIIGAVVVVLGVWFMQATQHPIVLAQTTPSIQDIELLGATLRNGFKTARESKSLNTDSKMLPSAVHPTSEVMAAVESPNSIPVLRDSPKPNQSEKTTPVISEIATAQNNIAKVYQAPKQRLLIAKNITKEEKLRTFQDDMTTDNHKTLDINKSPIDFRNNESNQQPATLFAAELNQNQAMLINELEIFRAVRPYQKTVLLSPITMPEATPTAPAVVRERPSINWFVAVTPLYTYQQIAPVQSDNRYVEQIQTPNTFSGGRAGWRTQIGIERGLSKQFSIRAGLTISRLRQSVQYTSRGASFDSARVEVLDDQTIRLTPLFRRQIGQLANVRHFVGINTDVVWRPFAASAMFVRGWQPYLTAGFSVGKYGGSARSVSGFWQASAGIERAIGQGWWLRVEPSVQYGWQTLTDNPVLTTRPYTYGLTIGLKK